MVITACIIIHIHKFTNTSNNFIIAQEISFYAKVSK